VARSDGTTDHPGAKDRVKRLYQWPSLRDLLVAASAITVVVSAFEIKLDAMAMFREVVSNFITCVSITLVTATILTAFGVPGRVRRWTRAILILLLLAIGGVVGGLVSWGINNVFFDVHMSHPMVYLMIVALLAIIFGLALLAYENISNKLEQTAAKLAEKEVQEQTLMRLKTEAELEALRAKVNPHFLFNTLNSIASLIPEDPRKAEDVVQRLSNLFHYAFATNDTDVVPLEKELDLVGEYLAIEKVRLGDRLDYAFEKDRSLDGAVIPSMLLQPLIENSVRHGIAPKKDGGKIDVRCERRGERCSVEITDTGMGFDKNEMKEGFGIGGVRQRLVLNYPGSHRFDVTSRPGHGAKVTMELPLKHEV